MISWWGSNPKPLPRSVSETWIPSQRRLHPRPFVEIEEDGVMYRNDARGRTWERVAVNSEQVLMRIGE